MQKHTLRTIIIWASIVLSLIYIYPTVGWMLLSPEAREARLAKWAEEDSVFEKPSLLGDAWKSVKRWAEFDRNRVINLGLDLQGGVHMVLGLDLDQADWEEIEEQYPGMSRRDITKQLQETVLQTVRRRVEQFEAQEPLIQALGESQVQVQLPGEKDVNRAKRLITQTAYLTFHIVAGNNETRMVVNKIEDRFPNRFKPFLDAEGGRFVVPVENYDRVEQVLQEAAQEPGLIPEGRAIILGQRPNPWDPPYHELYLVEEEPIMTGEGLTMAVARPDPQSPQGNYMILFGWNAAAAEKFGRVTGQNIGQPMAIVVDNVAVSAPVIQSVIRESGQITGNFSREQAIDLANALSSGNLPVPIREDFTGYVGATLGTDSVRSGVISALVGILLSIILTAVYYRVNGIIADIGLLVNALMLMALMAYFKATLTLPGIAGFILTIGMAVDANVLILERMREEKRNGRSLLATIESGYSRATATILDSNITTLIAALVLLQFGTGPVQGFAVTLSIGILTSVFSAVVVTRAIYDFLTRRGLFKEVKMGEIIPMDTNIDFMGKRVHAIVASLAVMIIGLGVFTYRQIEGPSNFGVDFTTGTNLVLRFDGAPDLDVGQLREALETDDFEDVRVQEYRSPGEQLAATRFLVHLGHADEPLAARVGESEAAAESGEGVDSASVVAQVTEYLAPLVDGDASRVVVEQIQTVGPAVGRQLIRDAILAVLYSTFFIMLYVWFRFNLLLSLGAVVALVHDVLITVGLFAMIGGQISMEVVAAILTVVGYSLNDTVVVFDRIREVLKIYRGRGLSYLEIVNRSVNETLSRTLLTSVLTLVVCVVLFFFGGAVLRDFAFVLIVGILVGTFSSIYVAGPISYYLQRFQQRYTPTTSGKPEPGSRRRKKTRRAAEGEEAAV